MLKDGNELNFSFSGLKSAVRREVEHLKKADDQVISDLCASFQQAVIEVLVDKLALAVQRHKVKEVHLAGGVSANRLLRQIAREKLPDKLPVYWPVEQIFCTDNAAMIASAAYFSLAH
jgi:N6-L-threonylcarbamoyladenine synthase